jgi:anti-sigma B factor antagonist
MSVDEERSSVDQHAAFRVQVSWIGDVAVVKAAGELDLVNAPLLHRQLEEITTGLRGDLIVDISQVTFLDSTGLSCLVTAHHGVTEQGGRFLVYGSTPQIRRLFEITGLTSLLTTFPE